MVLQVGLIVDGLEVSLFLGVGVLRESGSKIRSIHQYIPGTIKFLSIFVVEVVIVLLGIFYFGMWVDGGTFDLVTALVEGSDHFVGGGLLFSMWIL